MVNQCILNQGRFCKVAKNLKHYSYPITVLSRHTMNRNIQVVVDLEAKA